MAQHKSRVATLSDVSAVYDLLTEYTIEKQLGKEFTNSAKNFEDHFKEGLFKVLISEVLDEEGRKTVVGCLFLSFAYGYSLGRFLWIHCSYIKPNFQNRGIEQDLIEFAKKVSLDEGIKGMLITVEGSDVTTKAALEATGWVNMTTMPQGALDFWFTPNPPSTPEFTNNDYVIREGTPEDVGAVYPLLQKLIEEEELGGLMTNTTEDLERDCDVERDLYGSIVLEHRRRVDDQDIKTTHEIVGCMLYSKTYYVLKGKTYVLQGLHILPDHKGKGLGKALVQATFKACLDRNGDGFIYMILQDNIVSQSLFRSLQGTNWTKSNRTEPHLLILDENISKQLMTPSNSDMQLSGDIS